MWQYCGVVRSAEGLAQGLARLAQIRAAAERLDVRPTSEGFGDLVHALDLRGSLVVAEATLLAARARRETRGAHSRADYPALDPALQVNFEVMLAADGFRRGLCLPCPPS